MTLHALLRRAASAKVLVLAVVLITFTLGVFWFLHNFERKPYEVYRGISPAALGNPMLAAERYLQAMGMNAVSRKGIDFLKVLPSPEDSIVIRHLPRGLSTATNDRLMAWVESGGHLLLTPGPLTKDNANRNDLFSRLGVQRKPNGGDNDCGCPDEDKKETASPDKTGGEEEILTPEPSDSIIMAQLDTFSIQLRYNEDINLLVDSGGKANFSIKGDHQLIYEDDTEDDSYEEQSPRETFVEEDADWLLEYPVGAGRITVLSDMANFSNRSIGDYDHAFLLSWLLRDRSHIWLLYAADARPLPVILWNLAPPLWICLIVVLILAIWRMQRQSGTLLHPNPEIQRNLLAHIDGSGQYNWRLDSAAALIEDNRRSLLFTWARRKLGSKSAQDIGEMDLATLATKTGITREELEAAMTLKIHSEQDLIRTSRAMQHIRLLLQGGESTRHDR